MSEKECGEMPTMKPMLFNTEMVCALLNNRKTATRRVIKPQPDDECRHGGQHEFIRDDFIDGSDFTGFVCKKCGYGVCGPHFKFPVGTSWIRPPYIPGDILYVRETWCINNITPLDPEWSYKADYDCTVKPYCNWEWHPSIHMPREAARIFLRVTDVRVERLQDITESEAVREGFTAHGGNFALDEFEEAWHKTLKPAARALCGWDANPWVWVIEFERISREEVGAI